MIPNGTAIPPKGFVLFNQNQLGFALSAAGETIYLRSPNNDRVIDAHRFQGQANGVATGRYPDGAAQFHELLSNTPGHPNGPLFIRDVVINEIMYNPVSGIDTSTWSCPIAVLAPSTGGWRLRRPLNSNFAGTWLALNSYLRSQEMRSASDELRKSKWANALGNFDGRLGRGERLVLEMPGSSQHQQQPGCVTNTIHIIADEVTYGTGGRWEAGPTAAAA
jgi:hypothetical protein